jgi:hypothetical protein
MKREEPWYAQALFAHWKIITGTSLPSHWKTTENTKKRKGKKTLPLPQRGRRGYHEQQSHGGLNDTNLRSHHHLFQRLTLSENCKRHMRHHFGRLMANLIDLSRKAHPQRPPSLPPLSPSLPPSSPGAPQGGLQQPSSGKLRAWFHLQYNSTRNCQVEHHTIGPYNCFA